MKTQSLTNKKGEVNFRKAIYRQIDISQTLKGTKFHQNNARTAFKKLFNQHLPMLPYLDLGSASCVRSLVLENEFGASGFAGDISYDALKFCPTIAQGLHYKKLPTRIVLDIYHLPFKSNSLPFVFLFQTLHHLPDPTLALKEIGRVLAKDGYLYIGEEPIRQTLNLGLWRRGENKNMIEKILMKIGVLPFVTRIGKEEVEHGILEESFTLKQWKSFLSPFKIIQTEIIPFRWGSKATTLNPSISTRFFLFLLGGGISALCQSKTLKALTPASQVLACPDCSNRPPLQQMKNNFFCKRCKRKYKIKDDILFLLPKKLEQQIYGKI